MAKQMNSKLPSVEKAKPIDMNEYKPGEVYVSEPGSKLTGITGGNARQKETTIAGIETVIIELPVFLGEVSERLGSPDFGRIDIPPSCFTADDILAVRRLYMALTAIDVKLKSGFRVEKGTNHAVRYVLERLTDAVEQAMIP